MAEITERLGRLPLIGHAGEAWNYSVSTDVLGRLVELASLLHEGMKKLASLYGRAATTDVRPAATSIGC